MSESTSSQSVPAEPPDAVNPPPAKRPRRKSISGVTTVAHTEISGRSGPEPTRYGDWEKNGRCIDF